MIKLNITYDIRQFMFQDVFLLKLKLLQWKIHTDISSQRFVMTWHCNGTWVFFSAYLLFFPYHDSWIK